MSHHLESKHSKLSKARSAENGRHMSEQRLFQFSQEPRIKVFKRFASAFKKINMDDKKSQRATLRTWIIDAECNIFNTHKNNPDCYIHAIGAIQETALNWGSGVWDFIARYPGNSPSLAKLEWTSRLCRKIEKHPEGVGSFVSPLRSKNMGPSPWTEVQRKEKASNIFGEHASIDSRGLGVRRGRCPVCQVITVNNSKDALVRKSDEGTTSFFTCSNVSCGTVWSKD